MLNYLGGLRVTLRTTEAVRCKCGHEGDIRLAENDNRSAASECYTPVGLSGSRVHFDRFADWPEVFERIGLRCPACKTKLLPEDIVKQP